MKKYLLLLIYLLGSYTNYIMWRTNVSVYNKELRVVYSTKDRIIGIVLSVTSWAGVISEAIIYGIQTADYNTPANW